MKFCDKLVKQRKDNNMSQEQLATLLGISRQAVSKWESGSTIPDMAKILELCKILNCNLEDLVDDGVGSAKEIFTNKININNYLKEILDFITRTVNMFWSMRLKEKIKCIAEMFFIGTTLFIIWSIAGNIVNSIFYNILNIFPGRFYEIIRGISSVIYGLFGLISGIIIIIHLFKIRYLDYFITIEDNNATKKTLEEPIEIEEIATNDPEIKFIDKKKSRIIIRDPKHSTYSFFNFLGKIVLIIIKFILLLAALPCLFSFIVLVFGTTVLASLIKDGVFFLGITISLLGFVLLNFIVLKFIYNFILNQKIHFQKLFIILIIGLSLSGIGLGISFIEYLSFEEKTITEPDLNYNTKNLNIPMLDNVTLNFLEHRNTEIIIDETQKDIKLEIIYSENGDIELENYISNYYLNGEYKQFYNYDITYHQYGLNENFIETINYLIEQIKNKEIFYHEYNPINKIKIYTSSNNVNKLKNNNQLFQ